MPNTSITALPAHSGSVDNAGILHYNEGGVDEKLTISQVVDKIDSNYHADVQAFLASGDINDLSTSSATTTAKGMSLLDKPIAINKSSGDSDHDIDFSAGNKVSDDGLLKINLTSLISKRMDAAFALGSGNGGMRSGESLPTNNWIYLYLVSNADGSAVDVIGTTTEDGSTISGDSVVSANSLTKKVYLAAWYCDGSANLVGGKWHEKLKYFELTTKWTNRSSPLNTTQVEITMTCPPRDAIVVGTIYVSETSNNVNTHTTLKPKWKGSISSVDASSTIVSTGSDADIVGRPVRNNAFFQFWLNDSKLYAKSDTTLSETWIKTIGYYDLKA